MNSLSALVSLIIIVVIEHSFAMTLWKLLLVQTLMSVAKENDSDPSESKKSQFQCSLVFFGLSDIVLH